MRIELNEQQANLILQALGEMPAKFSYMLLQNLGEQIAAHNRAAQEHKTFAPPVNEAPETSPAPAPVQ